MHTTIKNPFCQQKTLLKNWDNKIIGRSKDAADGSFDVFLTFGSCYRNGWVSTRAPAFILAAISINLGIA